MRVLITGITGFAGSHLAEFIHNDYPDVEIFGIMRWRSRTENIEAIRDKVEILECDLRDGPSVLSCLRHSKPDRIFHLAAQSFVPTSWNAPAESLQTNILGELNIFEGVRELSLDPRIQLACSSEEYGLVHPDETPIKEENPLRPLSPYAVSKVAQDFLGYQYYKSYGMWIIRTRGFNHEGPRRGHVFVCSSFAKQLAEIEKGIREPVIMVGNVDARRDFTDVRDMVRAYWLILEHGTPGDVYNLCSGKDYAISTVLDMLKAMAKVPFEIKVDESRLRPSDVPLLLGDNTKFQKVTGWEPHIPFEKTLEDTLQYWRERV